MKKCLPVLCVAVAALLPAIAGAQFAKPHNAVEYRESVMTIMDAHLERLEPMMRGKQPFDAAYVQSNVALIQTLSKLPWPAFATGFEGGRAKEDVWKEGDKFKQASERFQNAVTKLADASQGTDQAQIRAAFGDVAESCTACHRAYRNRRER
jgi:cytochrome c556